VTAPKFRRIALIKYSDGRIDLHLAPNGLQVGAQKLYAGTTSRPILANFIFSARIRLAPTFKQHRAQPAAAVKLAARGQKRSRNNPRRLRARENAGRESADSENCFAK